MGPLWTARTSSNCWKRIHAWWCWSSSRVGAPAGVGAIIWPRLGEAQAQQGHCPHYLEHIQAKPLRPLWPEHQSHTLQDLLHELWLSSTWPKESTQGAHPVEPPWCCCKAWATLLGISSTLCNAVEEAERWQWQQQGPLHPYWEGALNFCLRLVPRDTLWGLWEHQVWRPGGSAN